MDGTTIEQVRVTVYHCDWIAVRVVNVSGSPAEMLKLTIDVTPSAALLACGAGDPAPGCVGKQPGEPPALVPDTRPRLYLGGDPGQVSMAGATVGNAALPTGTLAPAHPTSGKPNQYTRPVVGFRDQYRNPFVAHWTGDLPQLQKVQGIAYVALYAWTATQDASSTLHVDLYADGALVGQATVPGGSIR